LPTGQTKKTPYFLKNHPLFIKAIKKNNSLKKYYVFLAYFRNFVKFFHFDVATLNVLTYIYIKKIN